MKQRLNFKTAYFIVNFALIDACVSLISKSSLILDANPCNLSNVSYVTFIFLCIAGILGSLVAYTTQYKQTALFRMYLCVTIASIPLHLNNIYYYILKLLKHNLVYGIITIVVFYLITRSLIICLSHLQSQKKIAFIADNNGILSLQKIDIANSGKRFINYLIDTAVLVALMYRTEFSLKGKSFISLLFFNWDALFIVGYYYFFLERVFNTTAGKCITNTTIVNEQLRKPSFQEILIRTLCRFIPFDFLSYFTETNRGWHDRISNTYVATTVEDK